MCLSNPSTKITSCEIIGNTAEEIGGWDLLL